MHIQLWNDFEVWRCFKPYPELDRLMAEHPDGFVIKRSRREPIYCTPKVVDGSFIRYNLWYLSTDYWYNAKYIDKET